MPGTNGHGTKPERVALYLRLSSEEQREKMTIKIQREFLDGYCQLHGLEVAGRYHDDGVSGTIPLHERPEGRRLLEDAKEITSPKSREAL
jgi:site-specific DNA recombinase